MSYLAGRGAKMKLDFFFKKNINIVRCTYCARTKGGSGTVSHPKERGKRGTATFSHVPRQCKRRVDLRGGGTSYRIYWNGLRQCSRKRLTKKEIRRTVSEAKGKKPSSKPLLVCETTSGLPRHA